MADISKINAVLLANIAEIDDVLAANIAKVNGLVFSTAPAFTGLLDTYTGAAAAYSTRRLYSLYTGAALRVREDSGDTETDIGFDSNGDLDTAAIATHCGTANGYVTKWYGQESSGGTGSGNDAAQATSGNQPQIYDGTSVISKQGEPCVYFGVSSSANLSAGNIWTDASGPVSGFAVMNIDTTQTGSFLGRWIHMEAQAFHYVDTQWRFLDSAQASLSTPSPAIDTDYLVTFFHKVNQVSGQDAVQGAINGGTFADAKPANRTLNELRLGGGQYNLDANLKEVVVWNSGQNTNRSGIEGNVNAHFQIGNFGTPTSGLLYDYSGAAAAYSVRQLANTAALAMRIREDGTDTETDIGFDANGDLDTAAIASHCGSNNGYVVTWYDQSGNQVDASQGTSGSQPQIYNGTAVLTVNSKPAVSFDGSNDELRSGVRLSVTAISVTTVQKFDSTGGGQVSVNPSEASGAQLYMPYNNPSGTFRYTYRTSTVTSTATTNQMAADQFMNDQAGADVVQFFENGTQVGSDIVQGSGTSTNDLTLGNYSGGGFNADCHIQEVIVWEAGMEDDRTGIQSNINTYFSIY